MYFKAFYAIYYIYVAAISYFNIYLNGIGFSATQIGLMTSVSRAIIIFILPVWGVLADYFGANKKVLHIALFGTIVFLLSFLSTEVFLIVFILYLFYMVFQGPIVSLTDALLLNHLKEKANIYGKYRVWGSIGYMLAVTPFGYIIENTQARYMFIIATTVLLLAFLNVFKLPEAERSIKVTTLSDFKLLLKNKELFYFLLFTFFIEAPLMANFAFFPILFKNQGGGETLFGVAMLLAAGSELIIFHKSDVFFERFKLKKIFLISSIAFAIRWFLIAAFPIPVVLLSTQLLHSLTFALFHVTAVNYISRIVGEEFRATGQNLYASTISISTVFSTFLGGMIYDNFGSSTLYMLGSIIALLAGLIYFYKLNKDDSQPVKS
ncbi:MAG: MFS transporter [Halanaerobiales bacterium]